MLSIHEKLFLLALDEENGNILPFAKKSLAHGLAGGILAELALLDKVCSNEKRRLDWVEDSLTGDEILDEAIQEIRSSEKLRKLTYWVSKLSESPKKLRDRIGGSLAARGMLYQEDRRFFWLSPSEDNPLTAPSKFELKEPLRAAILSTEETDLQNLALLNVASAAGLLNLIFTQDELAMARNQIHEKIVRAALGNMVMQTVEEIGQATISSLEDDTD